MPTIPPILIPPIVDPLPLEKLIEMKRKAGATHILQFPPSLRVEFASLLETEVPMWRHAIEDSSKGEYVSLIVAETGWIAGWNADQFPRTRAQQ